MIIIIILLLNDFTVQEIINEYKTLSVTVCTES